jgi:hypothetical protein
VQKQSVYSKVVIFGGSSTRPTGERAPQIIVTVVLAAFFLENSALKKIIASNNDKDLYVTEGSMSSLIEKE